MWFTDSFRLSAGELKKPAALAGTGVLIALCVALDFLTITFSNILELRFTFLAMGAIGLLYGPAAGMLSGIAIDLITYLLTPNGAFFPGFTLNTVLSGMLCGLMLYRQPLKLWRVILLRLSVILLINLTLTPVWLSMMYGKSFIVYLSARLIKNAAMFPVEVILSYLLFRVIRKYRPLK